MKTLILLVVLAVLGFGVFEYHQEQKRQERERLEQVVRDCWHNLAPNSKSGAELCKTMAKRLEDK